MTIHNTLARSEEEGERWQNSISEHIQADAQILKNENTKALYDAIYQLTADQQSAFVMYYLDEKSVKDVAEILQKSPKAVESLLHRARCQMKILLQEHYQNMQS